MIRVSELARRGHKRGPEPSHLPMLGAAHNDNSRPLHIPMSVRNNLPRYANLRDGDLVNQANTLRFWAGLTAIIFAFAVMGIAIDARITASAIAAVNEIHGIPD